MPPIQVSQAGRIAPELVFMILSHVRHPRDTLPDGEQVVRTLRAVPLVCKSWHEAGMEMLYQRIVFTRRSSRGAKLLERTISGNPRLGELVCVLCFPELRFRPCDYYRNERSTIRLRNYGRVIALCPNVVFLRVPTNLQHALSPRDVPGLPLCPAQTAGLLSLHLTSHPGATRYASAAQARTCATLSFLPIHTSLPCLVHLTLANFTFTLEGAPAGSRLLFPYLPALRSLTLSACLLDERAATQMFNAVRRSLRHLELWQSGYLPELTEAAFRILGPTLDSLVVDEYVYEYHVLFGHPDALALSLPRLRFLKIAAEKLSVGELRRLPPSLERLKITALPMCACAACAKAASDSPTPQADADSLRLPHERGPEMGVALALALVHDDFDAKRLTEITLAGRCCAWHKWHDVLQLRCAARGIRLVRDLSPGECHDTRTPVRRRIDSILRRTSWPLQKVNTMWIDVTDRFSW